MWIWELCVVQTKIEKLSKNEWVMQFFRTSFFSNEKKKEKKQTYIYEINIKLHTYIKRDTEKNNDNYSMFCDFSMWKWWDNLVLLFYNKNDDYDNDNESACCISNFFSVIEVD